MSNPALARNDAQGRRFYTFGDPAEAFWSVTTLIGGGVPKYLGPHYAKMSAELAYDALLERGPHSRATAVSRRLARLGRAHILERQSLGELRSVKVEKQTDRDLALRWIKGAADRHRDAAALKGTEVHDEAEALVLQHAREMSALVLRGAEVAPWPERLEAYQRAFTLWIADWAPVFVAAEATVFNRHEAYAGTLDAVVRIPAARLVEVLRSKAIPVPHWLQEYALDEEDVWVCLDYKSGRAIYEEVALQLAAYARGEFVGAPDRVTELKMPHVDVGAVLHLRSDGTYVFQLVRIDDAIFDAFRFAREVYRWQNETARTVLLEDLTVDHTLDPLFPEEAA